MLCHIDVINKVIIHYRKCFMMLMECITVLDGVNGNHLIPPAVDVFQPEQQTVTHLMEVLLIRCGCL